jgi:hypothetical protein
MGDPQCCCNALRGLENLRPSENEQMTMISMESAES